MAKTPEDHGLKRVWVTSIFEHNSCAERTALKSSVRIIREAHLLSATAVTTYRRPVDDADRESVRVPLRSGENAAALLVFSFGKVERIVILWSRRTNASSLLFDFTVFHCLHSLSSFKLPRAHRLILCTLLILN